MQGRKKVTSAVNSDGSNSHGESTAGDGCGTYRKSAGDGCGAYRRRSKLGVQDAT